MHRMKCFPSILLFLLSPHLSKGTERCATPVPQKDDFKASEAAREYRKRQPQTNSHIIPVCFHVPQLSRDLLRSITNEDLQNELNHLNQAFTSSSCCDTKLSWCSDNNCSTVDAGISFAMATVSDHRRHRHSKNVRVTGTTNSTSDPHACITRPRKWHRFSLWYRSRSSEWSQSNNHGSMKAKYRIGNERVLNVYYVYPLNFRGIEILGYASYPWRYARSPVIDGVVLHTEVIRGGSISDHNEGDILVHEVGHWLGLFHTFEGGCSVGDMVDDTEPERIPNRGCAPEEQRDTCPGGGLDPIFNFMDYSSDECLYVFTQGQVERMIDNIILYRTPK